MRVSGMSQEASQASGYPCASGACSPVGPSGKPKPIGDFKQHLGNCVVDAFVERPAGVVGIVGGFSIFVVTLPMSAGGGNVSECWEKLVKRPARYTFSRPLGRLQEDQGW
jgi:hypothetical protein